MAPASGWKVDIRSHKTQTKLNDKSKIYSNQGRNVDFSMDHGFERGFFSALLC